MLETKKVFIDTEAFVKASFHFDGSAFKEFRKYCEKKELIHVSTTVVKCEVISKIEDSVKEAISAINTFQRKARILSSLNDEKIKGLFEEIPDEDMYQKSKSVFDEFMNACDTKIVNADGIDAENLLSLYFNKKPPFGDKKKKVEFPDAISLLSLKSYLEEGEKIYVVSKDGDLKAYCESDSQFIYVETLDKLLDIYTAHNNISKQVKQYFITNETSIKQKIIEFLEDCYAYCGLDWGEDAEIEEGSTVVEVGDIEPSVLYTDDKKSKITFDVDVKFEMTVVEPENVIYDKEDGQRYSFGSTSTPITMSKTFTVEISLCYDFIDGELVNAKDHNLYIADAANGIEVSVDKDDIYCY